MMRLLSIVCELVSNPHNFQVDEEKSNRRERTYVLDIG